MAETVTPNSGTWNGSLVMPDLKTYNLTMTLQADAGTLTGEYLIAGDAATSDSAMSQVTGTYADSVQIVLAGDTGAALTGTIQAYGPGQAQVLFGTANRSVEGVSMFVGICTLYNDPGLEVRDFSPAWDG